MTHLLFRHGDVLLQSIPAPKVQGARQTHLTLAHGEVTGHSHRIAEPHAAVLFASHMPQPQHEQFLKVTAPKATLIHEEHGPIELPSGWYRVWQQREYTPERVRTVID